MSGISVIRNQGLHRYFIVKDAEGQSAIITSPYTLVVVTPFKAVVFGGQGLSQNDMLPVVLACPDLRAAQELCTSAHQRKDIKEVLHVLKCSLAELEKCVE